MPDSPENPRSQYADTGMRGADPRAGFGDDAGTRVGRPDGAGSNASAEGHAAAARVAPHDISGPPVPGQPSTNTAPVPDGIEGSEVGDENAGSGAQQRRAQAASEGIDEGPAVGDDRRLDDL